MKKKILSMLLVLGMSVGLLAGCGGGNAGNGANAGGDAGNDAGAGEQGGGAGEDGGAPAADGEVYNMVMQLINYGFDDPDLGLIQDEVNKITEPKIGVHVTFMTTPIGDMFSKLGLLVSGEEQIDLVQTGLLLNPSILVAQGLLQPITQYINASDSLTSLAEGLLPACSIGGEIYAYPGSIPCGTQVTFFYDADLAEQYNITLPAMLSTPDDWENLFKQVKDSGMEQYPISLGDGQACEYEWADFDSLGENVRNAYGVIMNDDDKVINYYETDIYAAKCKLHREWWEKGYCVPDSISNGYNTIDTMTQGQIFGFVSNGGVGMSDAYWSKTTGKNIKSIPVKPDVTLTSDNIINTSWGVTSSCQNPEKVVKFLELMYTDTELANLMNYGVEGTHYVTTEGSRIINYPEGKDAQSVGYGSFVGTYGNQIDIYQMAPLTDEFVASIPNYTYKNAKPSKYLGYTFDQSSVDAEVKAVQDAYETYAKSLECGVVDPDEMLPQFIQALKDAGIERVMEENQKQLDAWLAQQ